MSREDQHFRLRLPADLREKVEAAAAESRRSLTAEILERLEASFAPRSDAISPDTIASLQRQLADMETQRKLDAEDARQKIGGLIEAFMALEKDMALIYNVAEAAGALPDTPSTPTPKRPSRAR